MVDGINTYGTGLSVTGVIQKTATPQRGDGGQTTGNTSATTQTVQSETINNLLEKEINQGGDFVSQAEAILNKALSLKSANTKLSIDVDDETGLFIYRGIDKQSGEVVSQFPTEEILALIAYYREAEGIVVDHTV